MSEPEKKRAPPVEPEKDEGYGESHGNPPGHGGPSGPGDVPATVPATSVPTPDDDES